MTVPQLAATTGLMAQALPGDPVPVRHHGWKPRADLPGVVELFAGLGCVARGFERSGRFQTVLLSDVDKDARSTFVANRPDSANIYLRRNVRWLQRKTVLDVADGREVVGLLGCPPCQGFSDAGVRDMTDPRNDLLRHFFRLLQALRPTFFLMENVPRVLEYALLQDALRRAETHYLAWRGVVNAALFGLPQTRQRAIVIGYRRDLGVQPTAPSPTHFGSRLVFDYKQQRFRPPNRYSGPDLLGLYPKVGHRDRLSDEQVRLLFAPAKGLADLVVVGEGIGDLPVAGEDDAPLPYAGPPSPYAAGLRADEVHNQRRWRHGSKLLERLGGVPEGGGPPEVGEGPTKRYFSQAYTRLHRQGLARTVTTNFHNPGSGRFLHYQQLRTITVREAARLQGIEDRLVFVGDQYVQERLVGNAFPVPLAEALARHIALELGDCLGSS